MFNKNNNIKGIKKVSVKAYKYNNLLLTSSLIEMIDNKRYNKELQEKMDYQDQITSYINRKHEQNTKKQYNPKIVNLYNNGLLVINNNEYSLKYLFIVFDDKINNFYLKGTDNIFNKEGNYNKAVKFIDTTAFVELINDSIIQDDKIIVKDLDTLNNIVSNWDGYLHSETVETDAILNKKMIKDDNNE